jgi:hypothetical protein
LRGVEVGQFLRGSYALAGIRVAYDGAALFERLTQLYTEVYTRYPEFEEVTVQLEERVKTHWQDYLHQERQAGKLEERNRILALLKQGYTPEQLETLLAQDVNPAPNR